MEVVIPKFVDVVEFKRQEIETWINLHNGIMNPVIKGYSSFNKLRWRGIKVVEVDGVYHLEQRGKRFGEPLVFKETLA